MGISKVPLTIYSWNVNGIRAVIRKELLQPFIDEHQPDILCIQETKAQQGQAEVDLPDYQELWNSAERKGYSGTAIFTKYEPLNVFYDFPEDIVKKYELDDGYGHTNKEGRVLTAEFENFYLSTVYTPNAKDDLSRIPMRQHWDPAYLEYMQQLEKSKPVVFCGDLNVAYTEDDLARPKENIGKKGFTNEERAGFEAFIDAGFTDTLRLFHSGNGYYTWWSPWGGARERNVGWRIDYFLVSESLKGNVLDANIHPEVMGSDHCPVSLVIDV
jgi:exodeoxyribonuclease-3